MKCPKNLLGLYIDHRLTEAERIEFEAHLRKCSLCQRELEQMQQVVDLLQACQAPEPEPQFLSSVMSQIELEPSPWELELSRRQQLAKYLGWGSISLALGVIVALFFVFGGYVADAALNVWLWFCSLVTNLSLPDLLDIWGGVKRLSRVVLDSFGDSQYLWPVLVVSGLCGLTLARELLDDIQRVLGYKK